MEQNLENHIESIPPPKFMFTLRTFRLGSIFFNLSLGCVVLSIIAFVSSFMLPLIYMLVALILFLLLLIMVVCTLGFVFAIPNNPAGKIWNFVSNMGSKTEKVVEISDKFLQAIPIMCIVGIISAVLSVVILAICKKKGKVSKIVFAVIFAIVMILTLILYYLLGGKLWQS